MRKEGQGREEGQGRTEGRKESQGRKVGRKEGHEGAARSAAEGQKGDNKGGTLLPSPASFLGASFFAERALKVEGGCEGQRKGKGQI